MVWQQKRSSEIYDIWAKRYNVHSGWESAEIVSNGNGWSDAPRLAVDSAGNAIAVWYQLDPDGEFINVWANTYSPTMGWGAADLLEDNAGDAVVPDIAMSPAGVTMVVWEQSPDGDGYGNIWGRSYTPRGGWGVARAVELSERSSVNPKVAVDPNGDAIAVWGSQTFDSPGEVWANRFASNRSWGTPEQLGDPEVGAGAPEVAVDDKGNALAVWTRVSGCTNSCNVWASKYVPSNGWGMAEAISEGAERSAYPALAFDDRGRAMLMWIQSDEAGSNAWINRYLPMQGWGNAALVEQSSAEASEPSFAFDSNGNAVAAWLERGDEGSVRGAIYTRSGGWKASERVARGGGDSYRGTDVAVDKLGRALVVWHQNNGASLEVWASRFKEDPTEVEQKAGISRN